MDGNEIMGNLRAAFARLLSLRLIISSPSEKVADLPLLYVILLVLSTPLVSLCAVIGGLISHYGVRMERELERRP